MRVIEIGKTLAPCVIFIKIAQFDVKKSCVHLRHATVDASVAKLIFVLAAIVGQCPNNISQFCIVCCHSSGIPHGTDVFARIETVCPCLSECSSLCALPCASLRLRAIFHKYETVCFAYVAYAASVCHSSIEMHNHHPFCLFCYMTFYLIFVNLQMLQRRFHKHGSELVVGNGEYGGYESVCWHNDFVTIVEYAKFLICSDDEAQGIKPIAHSDAMGGACISCVVGFKALRFFALQIPSAVNNSTCCFMIFIAMHFCDGLQVKCLYHSGVCS